jgi:hypothetical protein
MSRAVVDPLAVAAFVDAEAHEILPAMAARVAGLAREHVQVGVTGDLLSSIHVEEGRDSKGYYCRVAESYVGTFLNPKSEQMVHSYYGLSMALEDGGSLLLCLPS